MSYSKLDWRGRFATLNKLITEPVFIYLKVDSGVAVANVTQPGIVMIAKVEIAIQKINSKMHSIVMREVME